MAGDESKTKPPWSTRASVSGRATAIGLTVLYHPDLRRVGEVAMLLDHGARAIALLGRTHPIFRQPEGKATGGLGVDQISDREPLRIEGLAAGAVRIALPERRMSVELDGRTLEDPVEIAAEQLDRGIVLVLGRAVALLLHTVEVALKPVPALGLIGASRAMRELRQEIRNAADGDVPILLRGETGAGKDLVAAAIHKQSGRSGGPYVPVNLAAIPANLAESELFGHARGAFTGATQDHVGHFGRANQGTLFLDEVGDASHEIQVKLLRILEDKLLQPLGGKALTIDVRLVTATDRDLERAVAEGSFRGALLQRFEGYPVRVPPLRERPDDVPRLFLHFLRSEFAPGHESSRLDAPRGDDRPWLPLSFMLGLVQHTWPGNVRELRNVARQVAIANRGMPQFRVPESLRPVVDANALATGTHNPAMTSAGTTAPPIAGASSRASTAPEARRRSSRTSKPVRELSDEDIITALERNAFNLSHAAADLGISRNTLDNRIKACPGLRKASDLDATEIRTALAAFDGDAAQAASHLRVSARALVLQFRQLRIAR